LGPLATIREALLVMRHAKGGVIINIGSPGFMIGIPYYLPYVTSKAAFSALTRTLQAEINEKNIHICEFFPAYVKTPNKPESRVGEVSQDLIMAEQSNAFTRPQEPETIGRQLVRLALRPKTLTYSSFSAHMGVYFSQISSFRLKLARGMAFNARNKIEKQNNN
jgi:NAD(P)-dependent dehydrogenase (short-subunit alcohol dehydrogenase family)